MTAAWLFNETRGAAAGRFLVAATGYGHGGGNVDITVVRGIPTTLSSYSNADPFGDAAAVLNFAGITMFDDPSSVEFRGWLRMFSDVDIYWSPAIAAVDGTALEDLVVDPMTQQPTLQTPFTGAVKVWEGYMASFEFSESGLSVQCQGALFQLDRYQAKPFYPERPWPVERLIYDAFDHTRKPNLRTQPLQTVWPSGWQRTVPAYAGDDPPQYAPVIAVGANWTEYVSRATGSWEATLTSFIQNLLTMMITRDGDGDTVPVGDQWTMYKYLNRRPVLAVRSRKRSVDFTVWLGTPGVTVELSQDSTQAGNIIYGQGQDIHGTVWNNAIISNDGSRTDYQPLAADPSVYTTTGDGGQLVPGMFVTEVNAKFDTGFSQEQAIGLASLFVARDRDAGWTGTVTLNVDPKVSLPRWLITSGMTMQLNGFLGSGANGMRLHIAAVEANPEDGSVSLTVDTRYRDLLTVQEAINRSRDPLTPVKMLQVNQQSMTIDDIQQSWSYAAGCGYVPKPSRAFHVARPQTQLFPYVAFAKSRPPKSYPDYYVKVNATASKFDDRWTGPVPIRVSKTGSIRRTEFAAYDINGNVLKIPFHASLYSLDVDSQDMPTGADGSGPSPYLDNAFEKIDPSTGGPWPEGTQLDAPASLIIGWGNRAAGIFNRAGFSPGSEADGSSPTGLLIDSVAWPYDATKNTEYDPYAPNGTQTDAAMLIWGMFYADFVTTPVAGVTPQTVYIMGRMFNTNAGSE